MFFEATDLYRTLDLKYNPVKSSRFENNFKRTINCPATRANMNESNTQQGMELDHGGILDDWNAVACREGANGAPAPGIHGRGYPKSEITKI